MIAQSNAMQTDLIHSKKFRLKLMYLGVAILQAAIYSGCSYPLRAPEMVVNNQNLVFESTGKTCKVACEEAAGTNWKKKSELKADVFETALIESLRNSKLFRKVSADGSADYHLKAIIIYQRLPQGGFNMDGAMKVTYLITNANTGDRVYDKTVTTKGEATVGDAFSASARKRLVGERAAQKNINNFIWDISKVAL